jgi:hypothetical protein
MPSWSLVTSRVVSLRLPDLAHLHFYFWHYVRDKVYLSWAIILRGTALLHLGCWDVFEKIGYILSFKWSRLYNEPIRSKIKYLRLFNVDHHGKILSKYIQQFRRLNVQREEGMTSPVCENFEKYWSICIPLSNITLFFTRPSPTCTSTHWLRRQCHLALIYTWCLLSYDFQSHRYVYEVNLKACAGVVD